MSHILSSCEPFDAEGAVPLEAAGEWAVASQVLAMIGELLETPGLGDVDRAALRSLVDKYGPERT